MMLLVVVLLARCVVEADIEAAAVMEQAFQLVARTYAHGDLHLSDVCT